MAGKPAIQFYGRGSVVYQYKDGHEYGTSVTVLSLSLCLVCR